MDESFFGRIFGKRGEGPKETLVFVRYLLCQTVAQAFQPVPHRSETGATNF